LVVTLVATSVAKFLKVTDALAIAAPELSTMVPEMVPPTTCAGRGLELKAPRRSSSAAERQTTNFLESFAEPIAHLLNSAG
jgi:hypothetical protein